MLGQVRPTLIILMQFRNILLIFNCRLPHFLNSVLNLFEPSLLVGIQDSETRLIFQRKTLLYLPCIQVSIDLRHTYNFRVDQELTCIHLSTCIQDLETHFIFQSMALLYQPCIQVSGDLRHTYIFRVYQELTYIHLSTCIQDLETHLIFQSRAFINHVYKYPVI